MAKIRTVKPAVAKHETLFELEQRTGFPIRFLWVMLPGACDREGRFKWRPTSMKTDLLPFDALDFAAVLEALLDAGQLVKYRVGSEWFGWIPTFSKHQRISPREEASELPAPTGAEEVVDHRPMGGIGLLEGKGREGNWKGTENSPEPQCDSVPHEAIEPAPTFLEFPIVGTTGRLWRLTESQVMDWQVLFPAVNVRQEMRHALAWVQANPGRKKTGRGMPKFLTGWLTRSSDRHGGRVEPAAAVRRGPDEAQLRYRV